VLRPLPLLLVHGTEDQRSNASGRRLKVYEAAREPKELVTIEGAEHGICQDDGQPHATRVAELPTAFWDRYLRS
jgi:alpha-beta hydrolase superfamily lysophospholipase